MLKSSLRRSFLILALTLVMLPSLAAAARPAWGLGELGRTAWDLVFGAKHGCEIDPDGKPRCAPTLKGGCEIGPDGKPRCGPTPKGGCEIDPNGKPRCTP